MKLLRLLLLVLLAPSLVSAGVMGQYTTKSSPTTSDKVDITDVSASGATKTTTLGALPISTAVQSALNALGTASALDVGTLTDTYICTYSTATGGFVCNTDPASLGGDDLGSAVASDIVALWASGSCSGYLKSDGTCDTPTGSMTYPSAGNFGYTADGSSWATMTLDTDLASVSASDDTLPSAKATKAALDLKAPISSPTFTGTVTAPSFISSASDGNRFLSAINTVAVTETATLGRFAWLTDRYWIADGDDWTTRYFIDSSMSGSVFQAYDADLDDLADGSLSLSKVGAGQVISSDCSTYTTNGVICFETP